MVRGLRPAVAVAGPHSREARSTQPPVDVVRRRRLVRRIALGLALAALAAPLAHAGGDGGGHNSGGPAYGNPIDRGAYYGGHSPGGPAYGVRVERGADRIDPSTGASRPLTPAAREAGGDHAAAATGAGAPSSPTSGFNWADAGIGASLMLAVVVVFAGSMRAVRRRGKLAGI